MDHRPRGVGEAIRNEVAVELTRRDVLARTGRLGLGAAIASALPLAGRALRPATASAQDPSLLDGTLQAFFDTIIPGRPATRTELGHPIHPRAIAGKDPEPGAVEADALLLAHHPKLGFDTIAPAFLADLETRALAQGGQFLDLDYERRERTCLAGLAFDNPARVLWESAAAVAFAAFCGAANIREATRRTSVGYRVMGHPGTAPAGYANSSYGRRLNRGRTRKGSLP